MIDQVIKAEKRAIDKGMNKLLKADHVRDAKCDKDHRKAMANKKKKK